MPWSAPWACARKASHVGVGAMWASVPACKETCIPTEPTGQEGHAAAGSWLVTEGPVLLRPGAWGCHPNRLPGKHVDPRVTHTS